LFCLENGFYFELSFIDFMLAYLHLKNPGHTVSETGPNGTGMLSCHLQQLVLTPATHNVYLHQI